jgi:hypothetical protein
MTYNINTFKGSTNINSWEYWTLNTPNNNNLTLNSTIFFNDTPGNITLNNGSSFNGNGYSFVFTNINTSTIQLFNLQGGIVSNISIGSSISQKGVDIIDGSLDILGNTNINKDTILNQNITVNKNLEIKGNLISNLIITNTTQSISSDTGAIIVYGDATTLSNINIKNDINFNGSLIKNGNIYIPSQWKTLDSQIYYIDGNVGIGTMNPVEMLDIDGNVSISGITRIANTSQSALVVNGGVGIKKNLNVDENINIDKNLIVEDSATLNKDALLLTILNVAGNTNIQSNIIFSNTTDNNLLFGNNGAVIVSGGVGIGGNVTIDKNLRVRSNLMIGNASLIISEDSIGGTDDIIINSKLILNQSIKIANSISTYSSVNNIINTTKSIGILDRQQGTVLWAANISSSGNDVGQGICSDNLGGIYVTGSFSSNVTFYHENGVIGNTKIHSGNGDCFIAKYNNSGTVQWAANISGIGSEIGRSICSDNLGGIYVTGEFTSSTVNFYHANGVVGNTKIHSGNGDCFIAKYNNSGTIQWAANISGSGSEIGRSICSDNLGGIYVTGEFASSTVTFYHANGVVGTTKTNSGSGDCFIAKYNNSGTVQWAANISGSGSEIGLSICSDNLDGIYAIGFFNGSSVTFYHADSVVGTTKINRNNIGIYTCFIAKYNNSGIVQWVADIGSSSILGRSICSDNLGRIYITGQYGSSITFYNANGSSSGITKINSGGDDCYIACYQDAYYLPNLTTNENGITIKTLNVSGGITNVINNISTSIQSNKAVDFLWYNNRWFTK